ncbi:Mitochondrial thiamine pyrophosphate carrier 1 [Morella rubra]|uniref:Mitochondrial thiamine pyrophosphate carrier 1 n=1 Tax=Morella rubra TaxID=262757 RepID=A0A6A1UGY8_9ROSI|nr:Mitochondrial thiamine pyrophosphate carrier 1 [Morella rubra]
MNVDPAILMMRMLMQMRMVTGLVISMMYHPLFPGSMSQYNGVYHALREIGKNEGLRGLYRGLTPRLVMYMSQGAMFFASYEFFKRLFCLEVPNHNTQIIQYKQSTEDDTSLILPIPSPSSSASTSSSSRLQGLRS